MEKRGFNKKIGIILLVIGIFFLSVHQIKADNFAYTNGTDIYLNGTKQFYKGINYFTSLGSINSFPYYSLPSETEIQRISDYGFNAIRLPISMYVLRPGGQGQEFNATIMGYLNNTLNWSKMRNISVILDLQDYLNSTSSANELAGVLENNASTRWDEIATFWSYLANVYKNDTTLLGYDLLNEPINYRPFQITNISGITDLWRDWLNNTYGGDQDKLNKSWGGLSHFTTFDNDTNYVVSDNSSLLLYWQFDKNTSIGETATNVFDWSGQGNNGTVTSALSVTDGKIKGTYNLSGQHVIESAVRKQNYTSVTQFAVAFWMRCKYNQASGPRVFMAYGNSTLISAVYIYLYPANGGDSYLYTLFSNSSGATPTGLLNQVRSSSSVCNDEEWKHVVYQYTGAQAQLYINGNLDSSYNLVSDVFNITKFKVGWATASSLFNGSIDELMFYNRSLNFSEIWKISRNHKKAGDVENFSTAAIPSSFFGYDNDERQHNAQSTILSNPSFESWEATGVPTGWVNYTNFTQSTNATDGDFSLLIDKAGIGSSGYYVFYLTAHDNWTKDLVITFDAKVLASTLDDCYLKLECEDSANYYETLDKDLDFSNTSWNSYQMESEIDPRFPSCTISFMSRGNCKALIDNVNMTIEPHSNRMNDFYRFLDNRYTLFLNYVINEIRKNDTNHIIFFDSLGTYYGLEGSITPMNFNLPSDIVSNKLVYYISHYYNPSSTVDGWGYVMESYSAMNIPWMVSETGYNQGETWIDIILKLVKYGASGYFHWVHIANISALGYIDVAGGDGYYCNNLSSINCMDIVSGVDASNLSITPKGKWYKDYFNKILGNQQINSTVLLVYGDGSYNPRGSYIYFNSFRDQLDRYNLQYTLVSADSLSYNSSFPDTNYLNDSYYNNTLPDQTKIDWRNYDRILVVQDSYVGSAKLGYLLEDMVKAGKRVAFIGAPYIIKYPYYSFLQDDYLGNGIGKANTNYSFTYWFNSTIIPNRTSSATMSLTASTNFYELNSGQVYSLTTDQGYFMNVSLPNNASWIFQDCSWNTSNQLYLCGVPKYAGPSYYRSIANDAINITQSIIKWLYEDDSLITKMISTYNVSYLELNKSNGEKIYFVKEIRGDNLLSGYNITFPHNTKVWNFINKTVACENCSSLQFDILPTETKIYVINIANITVSEGSLTVVKDTLNNIVDDSVEVWFANSSTNATKHIDSNLTSTIDLTASFYVDNCSIRSISYLSETGIYSKTYSSSEWNCSNNVTTLNITGIEPATGSNLLTIHYSCTESWSCTGWSSCSGGMQTRTCTDTNSCGTIINKPTETQSCSSGGGFVTTTETVTIPSIPPEQPFEITVTNPNLEVTGITILTTEGVQGEQVSVEKLKTFPSTEEVLIGICLGGGLGEVYTAFSIDFTKLKNSMIKNATIEFKVNKTWFTKNNGTLENLKLFRLSTTTKKWEVLSTSFEKESNGYIYFKALTPGFSSFTVLFSKCDCSPNVKRCLNKDVQLCVGNATWFVKETCDYQCKDGACVSPPLNLVLIYTWLIGIILLIILTILLIRKLNKKKFKVKF